MRRRNISSSIAAGSVAWLFSAVLCADTDVDMTATIINNTCKTEISNAFVNLGTQKLDYFSDTVTANDDYPGGVTFAIRVVECASDGNAKSQLKMDFHPSSGQLPADNQQVFANDIVNQSYGAKNVGVVIFSAQDDAERFNVLDSHGASRAIFPIDASTLDGSEWRFYSRMQKISSGSAVTPGLIQSKVIVDVSYE
ncbi:fimbrial-like protein [Kluyvera sp. STS39-E]|uniref:fimbrial-like protein n=1 Tax=Kluyvera sp. STS39-E TaxID=3234748 RepID=UPI0034C5D156